jgi:hypothetical protein
MSLNVTKARQTYSMLKTYLVLASPVTRETSALHLAYFRDYGHVVFELAHLTITALMSIMTFHFND